MVLGGLSEFGGGDGSVGEVLSDQVPGLDEQLADRLDETVADAVAPQVLPKDDQGTPAVEDEDPDMGDLLGFYRWARTDLNRRPPPCKDQPAGSLTCPSRQIACATPISGWADCWGSWGVWGCLASHTRPKGYSHAGGLTLDPGVCRGPPVSDAD